jgi:hypothetical protein
MGYGAFWWLEYLTGPITIPQGVTRIEENTFFANRRITSYTIPASVTYIAQRGLGSGFMLESIYVDEDNPNYYVENNALIERDSKILLLGTKNTIIPDDVVEIGIAAFHFAAYAQNAQPLVIPNSVKIINDAAFHSDAEYLVLLKQSFPERFEKVRHLLPLSTINFLKENMI